MLGYQQAQKNFDARRTNRVILLTDGIANAGVIEPHEIAADSKKFNDQNIDLSTIGLGEDLDQDLLRKLSDSGRGLLHFIGDDQDLAKVFVQEIDSLLSSAAREVRLDIKFDVNKDQVGFFGYQPEWVKKKHRFELDDLNHDATQVIVGEIKDSREWRTCNLNAQLRYIDEVSGKNVEQRLELAVGKTESTAKQRVDLKKNYRIARLASGLREFVVMVEREQTREAYQHLKCLVEQETSRETEIDADATRILDICRGYLKECYSWNEVTAAGDERAVDKISLPRRTKPTPGGVPNRYEQSFGAAPVDGSGR
jgi:hypothetical protein